MIGPGMMPGGMPGMDPSMMPGAMPGAMPGMPPGIGPGVGLPPMEATPHMAPAPEPIPLTQPVAPPANEEITKSDLEGWRGGLRVKLDRRMKDGATLRDVLSLHLAETLALELKNHEQRIQKLKVWNNQYKGKKQKKSFPHPNAANVAIPLTRSNADTIHVRLDDSVWNKRKIFLLKSRDPEKVNEVRDYEDALEWVCKNMIHLKDRMRPSQQESVKFGTGCGKIVFEKKVRPVMRYATPEEESDKSIKKYSLAGTSRKAVKIVETTYEGPGVYPIAREDFLISSEATEIQDAYLVGFRTPYQRRHQIRAKVKQGLYDKAAVDRLLGDEANATDSEPVSGTADDFDETKKARAESKSIELQKTSYEKPFEIWELWLRYDVDDDGEEDDIVLTFHRGSGEILSGIYNPLFYGFRPFYATRFYPTEHSFDGEGVCEILAPVQEIIDTLLNQAIDAQTIANAPPIILKRDSLMERFKYLAPGKTYFTDENPNEVMFVPQLSGALPDNMNLINFLISMGDRSIGITPSIQGISTSERPVAKETYALLEEANKKFLYGQRQHQNDMTKVGRQLLEVMAQYMPQFTYEATDPATGQKAQKTVYFDAEVIRNYVDVELEASTELMSMETRREVRMAQYQMYSDYMTKAQSIVQAFTSPEVPSEAKKTFIEANRIGVEIMKRISRDFDERDPDNLVYDPFKVVDINKCLMQSADIIAQQQSQQGQPGPPPEGGASPDMSGVAGGPPQGEAPPMGPPPMEQGAPTGQPA